MAYAPRKTNVKIPNSGSGSTPSAPSLDFNLIDTYQKIFNSLGMGNGYEPPDAVKAPPEGMQDFYNNAFRAMGYPSTDTETYGGPPQRGVPRAPQAPQPTPVVDPDKPYFVRGLYNEPAINQLLSPGTYGGPTQRGSAAKDRVYSDPLNVRPAPSRTDMEEPTPGRRVSGGMSYTPKLPGQMPPAELRASGFSMPSLRRMADASDNLGNEGTEPVRDVYRSEFQRGTNSDGDFGSGFSAPRQFGGMSYTPEPPPQTGGMSYTPELRFSSQEARGAEPIRSAETSGGPPRRYRGSASTYAPEAATEEYTGPGSESEAKGLYPGRNLQKAYYYTDPKSGKMERVGIGEEMPTRKGASTFDPANMMVVYEPSDMQFGEKLMRGAFDKASGGSIDRANKIAQEKAQPCHHGIINMAVGGRTDHIPMNVLEGSYVLPADIVSGLGEGNTLAGSKIIDKMFGSGPFGVTPPKASGTLSFPSARYQMSMSDPSDPYKLYGKAEGGEVSSTKYRPIPIIAAGGEYVIHPDVVTKLGKGNMDNGHTYLDNFVKFNRKHLVKTLSKLPGPRKN